MAASSPTAAKRKRNDEDDSKAIEQQGQVTLGKQTSHIRNKIRRQEKYAKLKSKQKACRMMFGRAHRCDACVVASHTAYSHRKRKRSSVNSGSKSMPGQKHSGRSLSGLLHGYEQYVVHVLLSVVPGVCACTVLLQM